jgi:hypothetical protein
MPSTKRACPRQPLPDPARQIQKKPLKIRGLVV